MDELVTRIVLAGVAGSIFVYFMVKLLVDTWLEKKYADAWWKDLATNGLAVLFGQAAAFGLMFLLAGISTPQQMVEAVFVGIIIAATATFGHEAVKNYGQRGQQ